MQLPQGGLSTKSLLASSSSGFLLWRVIALMQLVTEGGLLSQERLDKAFVVNVPGFFHILWYGLYTPYCASKCTKCSSTQRPDELGLIRCHCTAGVLFTL